jgi:hypothetical protein
MISQTRISLFSGGQRCEVKVRVEYIHLIESGLTVKKRGDGLEGKKSEICLGGKDDDQGLKN